MTNVFAASNSSGGALYDDYDLTLKSTIYGAELKYYAVNHDKFAFYLAPTVGMCVANSNMKSNTDTYIYYNNSFSL